MKFELPTEDHLDYVSVDAGTYVCQIEEVREGTTRNGDPRWAIRLAVCEGEFTGRHAAWDGLVFSTRGRTRVRRALGAFGLPNQGTIDLAPKDLEGRRVARHEEDSVPTALDRRPVSQGPVVGKGVLLRGRVHRVVAVQGDLAHRPPSGSERTLTR